MIIYKKISENVVQRISDNAFIPFDPANVDYQEYLKWLETNNISEEANDNNSK